MKTWHDDPYELILVLERVVGRATRIVEKSASNIDTTLAETLLRKTYMDEVDKARFGTFEAWIENRADRMRDYERGVRDGVAEAVSILRAWREGFEERRKCEISPDE